MKNTSTTAIYKSTKEGKVRLTMTLDPRKGTDKDMPVCVRVRIGNLQRYFIMPEERYTAEEFASIINEDNRKMGKKRKEFDDFFDRIKRETKRLVEEGEFSPLELLEKITAKINGLKEEEEAKGMTIFDVWEQLLKELEEQQEDKALAPLEVDPQNPLNFHVVEDLPQYPGGAVEFLKWLTRNLRYPTLARERKTQGKVVAVFYVEKDGSITGIKITKSLSPECDREALRVLRLMPNWQPGIYHDEPCRTKVQIPIVFKL